MLPLERLITRKGLDIIVSYGQIHPTSTQALTFAAPQTNYTLAMLEGVKVWDREHNHILNMCEMADIKTEETQ